jgi:hypothetical protein
VFYPDQTDAVHMDEQRGRDHSEADADTKSSSGQKAARRRYERRGIHDVVDPHDVVMMYQFLAREQEKVRAYVEGCEKMAVAGERKGRRQLLAIDADQRFSCCAWACY